MKLVAIVLILVVAGAGVVVFRPRTARAAMLKEGDIAPSINTDAIFNDQIIPFHLSDHHGRQVVLYFYPKDNKIAKAYGAENGIPILGLDQRVTYVIGADGRILKAYPEVDPGTHARQIIHDLGADKPHPTPSPTAMASPAPAAHATRPARPSASDDDSE
jgi:hypothetical protein